MPRRNSTPKVTFEEDTPAPRRRHASMTRRKRHPSAVAPAPSKAPPTSILYKKSNRPIVLHGRLVKPEEEEEEDIPKPAAVHVVRTNSLPTSSAPRFSSHTQTNESTKSRPVVLHGRVVKGDDDDDIAKKSPTAVTGIIVPRRSSSFRENLERRRILSTLTNETADFQKQVTNLETVLGKVQKESTTDSWRARNKIKAVLDIDKKLWEQLFEYEKRLTWGSEENTDDLRAAQTECLKLHRDFKRSHKALVMVLSLYETRQHGDASQLGAVGWTGGKEEKAQKVEEFVDTRFELKPVEPIRQDPTERVVEQKEDSSGIEEDEVITLPDYEEAKDPGCLSDFCGAMNCTHGWLDDVSELHRDSTIETDEDYDEKSGNKFGLPMSFQTLKRELLLMAKEIEFSGKRLHCGSMASTAVNY